LQALKQYPKDGLQPVKFV